MTNYTRTRFKISGNRSYDEIVNRIDREGERYNRECLQPSVKYSVEILSWFASVHVCNVSYGVTKESVYSDLGILSKLI